MSKDSKLRSKKARKTNYHRSERRAFRDGNDRPYGKNEYRRRIH